MFSARLFGQQKLFFGWSIKIIDSFIKLDQVTYARKLSQVYVMDTENFRRTLLPVRTDMTDKEKGEAQLGCSQHSLYRSLMRGLLYFSFRTSICSSQMLPRINQNAFVSVKSMLQYALWTVTLIPKHPLSLQTLSPCLIAVHCEADLMGCKDSRKSNNGYLLVMNGTPIEGCTRGQTIIALS